MTAVLRVPGRTSVVGVMDVAIDEAADGLPCLPEIAGPVVGRRRSAGHSGRSDADRDSSCTSSKPSADRSPGHGESSAKPACSRQPYRRPRCDGRGPGHAAPRRDDRRPTPLTDLGPRQCRARRRRVSRTRAIDLVAGCAQSDQVVPRRPNRLTHFPDFKGSRPDPTGHDPARHFGSHFGSPSDPIDVRHPGTSKPPTAFPLVGGPSSVSTQSAPEGIRTPNLLIRSNSIDPTPTEAPRPQTKPRQMFTQVTGVRTRQGGPGRGVTELRSRGILGHILGQAMRVWLNAQP